MADCDRAEYLSAQIAELLDLADAALEDGDYSAAVSAKVRAGEMRAELDKLRAYLLDAAMPRDPLEQVRAMRQRADAAGSHVAARDFFKLELELLEKAEAAKREEERARLEHLTEAEIIDLFVEHFRSLPSDLQDRVREAAFAVVH